MTCLDYSGVMKSTPTYLEKCRKSLDKFVVKGGADECWPWTGYTMPFGHGQMTVERRGVLAHRATYLVYVTDPGDFNVCHTCDNPPCCNPAHLFTGTHQDNMDDRDTKGRHHRHSQTHCKRGHEFTDENTKNTRGRRECRACHRLRDAEYRERKTKATGAEA